MDDLEKVLNNEGIYDDIKTIQNSQIKVDSRVTDVFYDTSNWIIKQQKKFSIISVKQKLWKKVRQLYICIYITMGSKLTHKKKHWNHCGKFYESSSS